MRFPGKIPFMIAALAIAPAGVAQEKLFEYQGKSYSLDTMSPAQKQALYEVEFERYMRIKELADQAVLEMHIDAEALKQKKTPEEVKKKLFDTGDPSEKEMKEFYDKNKDKIPYPYDQVKDQLKQHMKQEKATKTQQDILEKVKKQGAFAFKLPEPVSPVVEIKTEGMPVKGNAGAKVTVVEFADYQCPHCREAFDAWEKAWPDVKEKIRFVYVDYPINASGISKIVAQGAYCANKQNKFWEYHSMAFKRQAELSKEIPKKFAEELKLDVKAFEACVNSKEALAHIEKSKAEGDRVGIRGTPTIFLNGRRYVNAHDPEKLKEAINKAL